MESLRTYTVFDNEKPINIVFLGNGKYLYDGFYCFLEPQMELSKTKYIINKCQERNISSLFFDESKESNIPLYLYICIGEKENVVSEFTTGKLFISRFPYQELSKNLRIKGSNTVIQKKNIIPITKENIKLVFEYNKNLHTFKYYVLRRCKVPDCKTITIGSLEFNICTIYYPFIIKRSICIYSTFKMRMFYENVSVLLDMGNYKHLNKNMRDLCSNAIKINELPEKLSEPLKKWALDNL